MSDFDHISWNAWTPQRLQERLRDVHALWYIVGGWALDLWAGRQTRPHADLEFCILREDFATFQGALNDYPLFAVSKGNIVQLGPKIPEGVMQFWGLDPVTQTWSFDMMIEPGMPDSWAYKRDPSFIQTRADMIKRDANDIPYLCPQAVLLFKAKQCRAKDEQDFASALPDLNVTDRNWLRSALEKYHPDHDWIARL